MLQMQQVGNRPRLQRSKSANRPLDFKAKFWRSKEPTFNVIQLVFRRVIPGRVGDTGDKESPYRFLTLYLSQRFAGRSGDILRNIRGQSLQFRLSCYWTHVVQGFPCRLQGARAQ